MNESRQQQLLASQSGLARKVYEAVPIQACWSETTILNAARLTGVNTAPHVIRACLRDMKDSGLIREPTRGEFQRETVTIKAPKPTKPILSKPAMTTKQPETVKSPVSPIDLLSEVSTELASIGTEFLLRMQLLSTRVDELALSIEAQRETDATAMAKAHQLQALLKEFAA
ncbi:hypothetical protein NL64_06310 [Pseudomonas fluorescens]|uniref:hypothetical protein n=1 Tax=Pseudomonas fluorescens TaxID=294 RepID=UPI00054B673C|nr:hypothetical protein [Pseudomonas fluorescens]KII34871.1 hypothetical protein NL64_06310 [Pseudomonas fluorescens]